MTLIGKIFTILIFIMSLLFLGFSINVYQTHVDLKLAAQNEKTRADSLDTQIDVLKTEKATVEGSLKREQIARAYALAALETQVTAIESESRTARSHSSRRPKLVPAISLTLYVSQKKQNPNSQVKWSN